MPYNGSGSFTRVHNWQTDKSNSVKITASRMDAEFDGIATGLSNAICKDGQTTVTADIPMNDKKITGLGNATADTDALSRQAADAIFGGSRLVAGGRLTLSTGVAVMTATVSGAATLYYTPYLHDTIGLYNSSTSRWVLHEFSEMSIALSGGTASKPHDVFLDYNGGSPALTLTAWTDDTTRATALTTQDGVLVLTGDTEKRYLGTIYVDSSNQCNFILGGTAAGGTAGQLDVWNAANRVPVAATVRDNTDTWTYASAASWRAANNSATNRVTFVHGQAREPVEGVYWAYGLGTNGGAVAVGLDSVTVFNGGSSGFNADAAVRQITARRLAYPGVGRHFMAPIEIAPSGASYTFVGDNGGTVLQMSFQFQGYF